MKPTINTGRCLVANCPNEKRTKGLCATHISKMNKGDDDYSSLITAWEVEREQGVIGYWTYRNRLKGILRGVDVSRAQRSAFNTAMLDAYAKANPEEMRGIER